MDSKEIRIDLSISDPKRIEDNIKLAKKLYRLNHAMPYTQEYDEALTIFAVNLKRIVKLLNEK